MYAGYPSWKPWLVNFRVRLFSATVRTTWSGATVGTSASMSSVTRTLAPTKPERWAMTSSAIWPAQLSLFRQGLMLYELLPRTREDRLRALRRRFGELLRHHVLFTGILGVVQ